MYKLALPHRAARIYPCVLRIRGDLTQLRRNETRRTGGWKARKKAGIRRWKTKSHTHRVCGDINARCNDRHSFSASFSANLAVISWKMSNRLCLAINLLWWMAILLHSEYLIVFLRVIQLSLFFLILLTCVNVMLVKIFIIVILNIIEEEKPN